MRVTLDLTKLLEQNRITAAEFDRLAALASEATASLALNILIGFGVVAVAGGAIALVPVPAAAVGLGAIVLAIGVGLLTALRSQWALLGNICTLVGSLMLAAGIVILADASIPAFLLVAGLFAATGVLARSGLLIVGAVLALASCLGERTGYLHATYFLGVEEPALTIVAFSAIALVLYLASRRLGAAHATLALVAARTALFEVNFGFWIGSLWGDRLIMLRAPHGTQALAYWNYSVLIPDTWFAVGWAVALVGVGLWAAHANRRWVVLIAAVFGAIHFYTQWFERLGATPLSMLIAGLITLAAAIGIWLLKRGHDSPATSHQAST
jgi:hypothetical protein